jgi:uncharacterized protein YkwD
VTPLSRLAVNSGTAVAAAPVAIPVFEVVGSGGLEAVVAVPAPAAVIGTPAPAAVSAPASATNDGAAMAAMVNSARAANGLAALKFDEQLTASGLQWSQDMAVNGFRHRDLSTLAQPTAHALGENIAQGTNVSVAKLHDALMNSTGHRENILSTTFTRIGIGVFRQGNALWITQEFAG